MTYDQNTIEGEIAGNNAVMNDTINNLSPFEKYIMEAEGWHGSGADSPEGGTQTVGYGRKLKEGESYENLTREQGVGMMREDIQTARDQAMQSTINKYGADSWEGLDENRQNMLTDFAYNTGQVPWMLEPKTSGRYTRFGDAIMSGDREAMMAEEEGDWIGSRYFTDAEGNRQSLGRNKLYRDTFGLN